MSELEYFFKRILKKQEEIGYKMVDYLKKGLTNEEITLFEKQHGIEFNNEYRDYLSLCNGVSEITPNNCRDILILPMGHILVSIKYLSEFLNLDYFNELLIDYEIENLSVIHIPILYHGIPDTYWVNIDKNDTYYGFVLETSKGSRPEYVFQSITRMFETICVAYELGVIFYNISYKTIDIDTDKYYEIYKKINPEMKN